MILRSPGDVAESCVMLQSEVVGRHASRSENVNRADAYILKTEADRVRAKFWRVLDQKGAAGLARAVVGVLSTAHYERPG